MVIEGYFPKDWREQCWEDKHDATMGHSLVKEIWNNVDDARKAFGNDFVRVRIQIDELPVI
jgi:hypothetical protein